MLNELITHAKKHRMKMIVLSTSNTQVAVIQLYMKYGFKVTTRSANESGKLIQRPAILSIITDDTKFWLILS